MARPLPGGTSEIAVSVGRELLARFDAKVAALGTKRSRLIVKAMERLLEQLDDEDEGLAEELDAEDREHQAEQVRVDRYVGVGHHAPRALGGGRWVARYPADWSDEQCVEGIRHASKMPRAVVTLHRTGGVVLTVAEDEGDVERRKADGLWSPAPWTTVHEPAPAVRGCAA